MDTGGCEECGKIAERVAKIEAILEANHNANLRFESRQQEDLNRRFRDVNEFRNALSDLSRLMLPRTEYDARHNTIVAQMEIVRQSYDILNSRIDKFEGGRSSAAAFTGWILSGMGILIAVIVGWLAYIHALH